MDLEGILVEVLQNAKRAGSNKKQRPLSTRLLCFGCRRRRLLRGARRPLDALACIWKLCGQVLPLCPIVRPDSSLAADRGILQG